MSRAGTVLVAWLSPRVLLLPTRYDQPRGDDAALPRCVWPQLDRCRALVGIFYYGYSPLADGRRGVDGLGPRKSLPIGAAMVGIGALLFNR
jgi:hypothetical protein